MTISLNELAAILEQELAVAEKLENNLAAQKQAIVDWNAEALLATIDAREPWLRRLEELEAERSACLAQHDDHGKKLSLRDLLALAPPATPELPQLRALQQRAKRIFTRLHTDERRFNALLKNLSNLIDEAWSPLAQSAAPTYGENGAGQRPTVNLLHSRA